MRALGTSLVLFFLLCRSAFSIAPLCVRLMEFAQNAKEGDVTWARHPDGSVDMTITRTFSGGTEIILAHYQPSSFTNGDVVDGKPLKENRKGYLLRVDVIDKDGKFHNWQTQNVTSVGYPTPKWVQERARATKAREERREELAEIHKLPPDAFEAARKTIQDRLPDLKGVELDKLVEKLAVIRSPNALQHITSAITEFDGLNANPQSIVEILQGKKPFLEGSDGNESDSQIVFREFLESLAALRSRKGELEREADERVHTLLSGLTEHGRVHYP